MSVNNYVREKLVCDNYVRSDRKSIQYSNCLTRYNGTTICHNISRLANTFPFLHSVHLLGYYLLSLLTAIRLLQALKESYAEWEMRGQCSDDLVEQVLKLLDKKQVLITLQTRSSTFIFSLYRGREGTLPSSSVISECNKILINFCVRYDWNAQSSRVVFMIIKLKTITDRFY